MRFVVTARAVGGLGGSRSLMGGAVVVPVMVRSFCVLPVMPVVVVVRHGQPLPPQP